MSKQTSPNQANMILVMVLTSVLLFGWPWLLQHFYPDAHPRHAAVAVPAPSPSAGSDPATLKPTREGWLSSTADQAMEDNQLKAKLAPNDRVTIAAPGLSGSINLAGGVIDDLTLNHYKATVDKNSGPVRLFSPEGTLAQHFAEFGWHAANNAAANGAGSPAADASAGGTLPTIATRWTAPAGARLTPQTPVTLSWTNPAGAVFTLTYAIDADYMITVTQGVANKSVAPLGFVPLALIDRTSRTASQDSWNIHSGPFGAFDGGVSFDVAYKCAWHVFASCADVEKSGTITNDGATNWLGFTDIYWMSVLVPDAAATGTSSDFRALGQGIYAADLLYRAQTLTPGQSSSQTTRLFAGAKESLLLDHYESGANGQPGIVNFGHAIDWGWFMFFEKPIFWLLRNLFKLAGNFGVAIVALTVIVRGVMFPIAQRQFASMAAMRALQPKIKALQERLKDDKPKLQEETMKLYKEEGVNPMAGCLPTFLQIPIFFALYKVLMVTIEMRQQPFVLWIRDLSAPDPMHILNLFGLLPFTPPAILGIGLLGLLLGITMYFQFRLSPQQADPAQQQVMAIMPWMMMFVMSSFASGLLLYWITSNCLTMAQQAYFYKKHPALKAQAAKDAGDAKRAQTREAK